MADKKEIPFAILKILEAYSDEDHPLPASEIMNDLESQYELDIERRTLYANIDTLRALGYDIVDYSESGKGYYLRTRQFDKGEILLLCNAVHASNFISSSQSKVLIHKLLDTLSKEQRKEFSDNVFIDNNRKTENQDLLKNVKKVSDAIRDGKMVHYKYLHYDFDKKQHPVKEADHKTIKIYKVEPRFIVYRDDRAYMIATQAEHPGFAHYRLDRMKDVIITDKPVRALSRKENTDAYVYARNKLFMFSGEEITAVLHCKNAVLDQMIDLFGKDARITKGKDDCFDMMIKSSRQGILYLAQQYLDAVTIVSPDSLRKEMEVYLKKALKEYRSL